MALRCCGAELPEVHREAEGIAFDRNGHSQGSMPHATDLLSAAGAWRAQGSTSSRSTCRCRRNRSQGGAPRTPRGVARVRRTELRRSLAFLHSSWRAERLSARRLRKCGVPVGDDDGGAAEHAKASHRGVSSRCCARPGQCRIAAAVQGFEDSEVLAEPGPQRASPRPPGGVGPPSGGRSRNSIFSRRRVETRG